MLNLVSAKGRNVTYKTQNRPKTQLTFGVAVCYVVFVRFFGKFVENGEVEVEVEVEAEVEKSGERGEVRGEILEGRILKGEERGQKGAI